MARERGSLVRKASEFLAQGVAASAARSQSGEMFRKMSQAEQSRYYKAQHEYAKAIEFDPDTQLTESEQALLLRILEQNAETRPVPPEVAVFPSAPTRHEADESLETAGEEYRTTLTRRLTRSKRAQAWLDEYSCGEAVINHFSLGLSKPYLRNGSMIPVHADALVAPLLHRDGRFYKKYAYLAVPDVTVDNREQKAAAWSAGDARAYYSGLHKGQKQLFVCDGLLDLWAVWNAIRGTSLIKDLLLVTSTNSGSHPDEWKDPEFWEGWARVYLGHNLDALDPRTGRRAGDERAKGVARRANREMHRIWSAGAENWSQFFKNGKKAADFEQLLSASQPLSAKDLETQAEGQPSWFVATPIDIAGGFHNGFLYEVMEVGEHVTDPESGELVQRLRTIVVRSDRTTHTARQMQAPKGTPQHQLIHRLWPDGAVIQGPLKPRPSSTWNIESIQKFIRGQVKYPPIAEQIKRVCGHLRASVWLPNDDDYMLLACTAVVTYVQPIFESVPLLLATGAAGTGKTQLGIAMTQLCANSPGSPVGQISAASIARLIDQTRGFIALDDLENVGKRRGGDAQFDELVQALKLSYNQKSAVKYWTNMKTGRLERLNFFGVKLIGNTRGVDAILGSRMFTIATRVMPQEATLDLSGQLSEPELVQLRNELHTWAFSSVTAVNEAYTAIHPNKSTRAQEIAAPLRTVSRLAGDADIEATLQRALERQSRLDVQPETPEQVLREALINIVTESINETGALRTVVTITEVIMRMTLLVDPNFRKAFTNELSDIESPEWVGRQLKQQYVDTEVRLPRTELYGKFLRSYQLADSFIAAATEDVISKDELARLKRSRDPRDFCRGCSACPYRNACDMRAVREAKEAQESGHATH